MWMGKENCMNTYPIQATCKTTHTVRAYTCIEGMPGMAECMAVAM